MLSVTISSNSSGVVSAPVLPIGPEPPATLTRMSMRPKASFVASAAASSHCVGVGQVAGHHDRLGAGCAHLLRHRLDRRDVAPDQRELRAFRGERRGDRRAHALGRSGDHRDAAFQFQVHCMFPVFDTRSRVPRPLRGRDVQLPQNSFFGRSATGGRKAAGEDFRRPSACAAARWPRPGCRSTSSARVRIDIAEADLGDLRMVHLVLAGWRRSARARRRILISGSRLATAATEASGSFSESMQRPC